VSKAVYDSGKPIPIPERRPPEKMFPELKQPAAAEKPEAMTLVTDASGRKMLYCKQCGYVVYREEPPYVCPICKAKKEFFAELPVVMRFSG